MWRSGGVEEIETYISTRKRSMRCFSPAILLQHHNAIWKTCPNLYCLSNLLVVFPQTWIKAANIGNCSMDKLQRLWGQSNWIATLPLFLLRKAQCIRLDLQNHDLVHPVFSGIFPAIKFWTFVNQMISREQSRTICTYPTISKYLDI